MIKSKVKQNDIEEAISDYNAIYTQNINTTKGTHAFINKEILSAGAGDNITGGSVFENIEVTQNAINSILKNVIRKNKNLFTGLSIRPVGFSLSQNYPNPFNPITKISYELRVTSYVSLKVYDMLGKGVAVLVNQKQNGGRYEVEFDGSNLPSGVYYYKIKAGNFEQVKKMMLVK